MATSLEFETIYELREIVGGNLAHHFGDILDAAVLFELISSNEKDEILAPPSDRYAEKFMHCVVKKVQLQSDNLDKFIKILEKWDLYEREVKLISKCSNHVWCEMMLLH